MKEAALADPLAERAGQAGPSRADQAVLEGRAQRAEAAEAAAAPAGP